MDYIRPFNLQEHESQKFHMIANRKVQLSRLFVWERCRSLLSAILGSELCVKTLQCRRMRQRHERSVGDRTAETERTQTARGLRAVV